MTRQLYSSAIFPLTLTLLEPAWEFSTLVIIVQKIQTKHTYLYFLINDAKRSWRIAATIKAKLPTRDATEIQKKNTCKINNWPQQYRQLTFNQFRWKLKTASISRKITGYGCVNVHFKFRMLLGLTTLKNTIRKVTTDAQQNNNMVL